MNFSPAVPSGVPDVIFHMPGIVGFKNQGIGAERRDIDVVEDALGVNSMPLFRKKDLRELFECYVHIHLLTPLEDPEIGIQFYANVLRFLHDDGFIV